MQPAVPDSLLAFFADASITELSSLDMAPVDHSHFRHSHDFVRDFSRGERRTRLVIVITGVMMVVEITAGLLSHSTVARAMANPPGCPGVTALAWVSLVL